MKIAATVVTAFAVLCCTASAWLFAKTLRFYFSNGYAPSAAAMPSYSIGSIEADGSGIFLPAGLLMILGLFLARFAWNLWRDPR